VLRVFGQASKHERTEDVWNFAVAARARQRRRRRVEVSLDEFGGWGAAGGEKPPQQIEEKDANALHVAPGAHPPPPKPLGAGVFRSADGFVNTGADELLHRKIQSPRRILDLAGEAEVEDLEAFSRGAGFDDQEIGRLEVPVDDAAVVSGLENGTKATE